MQAAAPMLGGFVHRSTVASSPHDPHICLGSHCLRSAFGETVQLVADTLQTRGPMTLKQIQTFLRDKTHRKQTLRASSIRASLLVLLLHGICSVEYRNNNATTTYYIYHPDQAVYILRYAKFIEWTRKTVDATAACVVETLCLAGRMRTADVILQAAAIAPKSDRYTTRETALEAFYKLAQAGFLQKVMPLRRPTDEEEEDAEWKPEEEEKVQEPPRKKVKLETELAESEDIAIVSLMQKNSQYKSNLPLDAVWRVNLPLFHEHLRAYTLGKLVAERYNHKVQSCGSMVTAALRFRSFLRHGKQDEDDMGEEMTFSPDDIIRYLPKPVLQNLEKKHGGVAANLSKALKDLSELNNPVAVRCISEDRFQIHVRSLAEYLHDRIIHKIVCDQHGETGGRVISIMSALGWLESDKIAEYAMVPAKDTREILHRLYRSQYCDLFSVSMARMPNPSNSTYLWRCDRERLAKIVTKDVALALWNIRLRRQHEAEVGKQWIERAQQAGDTDENDHETDRINYQRFCVGLERLDSAALQLDETLMILRDF